MKDYILGIVIPYYKSSLQAEQIFKFSLDCIMYQIRLYELEEEVKICICEDGQKSRWLDKFKDKYNYINIELIRNEENKGISYSRNRCIEKLIPECKYITFVDADDRLTDGYIVKLINACRKSNKIIQCIFNANENIGELKIDSFKNHVTAIVWPSYIFKDKMFDENLRFAEDKDFLDKYFRENVETELLNAEYYYNYGLNKKCLSYTKGEDHE